jgi:hypothetical protein
VPRYHAKQTEKCTSPSIMPIQYQFASPIICDHAHMLNNVLSQMSVRKSFRLLMHHILIYYRNKDVSLSKLHQQTHFRYPRIRRGPSSYVQNYYFAYSSLCFDSHSLNCSSASDAVMKPMGYNMCGKLRPCV